MIGLIGSYLLVKNVTDVLHGGIVNGVKTIILKKYHMAIFVHCALHCLNLVVNDMSKLGTIRNIIDTNKTIIKFFRDSEVRREALTLKSFC